MTETTLKKFQHCFRCKKLDELRCVGSFTVVWYIKKPLFSITKDK